MFIPLQHVLVVYSHPGEILKRESGANPEQSRCCNFHQSLCNTHTTGSTSGKVAQAGKSQKTCQILRG